MRELTEAELREHIIRVEKHSRKLDAYPRLVQALHNLAFCGTGDEAVEQRRAYRKTAVSLLHELGETKSELSSDKNGRVHWVPPGGFKCVRCDHVFDPSEAGSDALCWPCQNDIQRQREDQARRLGNSYGNYILNSLRPRGTIGEQR